MKTVKIKGMSCQHCVMAVTKALRAVAGVTDVRVNLESGEAVIDEEKTVDMKALEEAVKKAGYEVE